MAPDFVPQILVAGIGNEWLGDDAFGAHVARALEERETGPGVTVLDVGIGGLDLAYEVMRGYDALVLVDVSRQGGEPGTLYLIDPDPAEITPIEDGEVVSPHGMDPKTVLRFVKTVGGWPGKVVIVACEPTGEGGGGMEMGLELSTEVANAVERAADLVLETIAELRSEDAYA